MRCCDPAMAATCTAKTRCERLDCEFIAVAETCRWFIAGRFRKRHILSQEGLKQLLGSLGSTTCRCFSPFSSAARVPAASTTGRSVMFCMTTMPELSRCTESGFGSTRSFGPSSRSESLSAVPNPHVVQFYTARLNTAARHAWPPPESPGCLSAHAHALKHWANWSMRSRQKAAEGRDKLPGKLRLASCMAS